MKSPVLIISSIIMLIAGIVLCWFNGQVDILRLTVLVVGIAFVVGGLINLVGITAVRKKRKVNALLGMVSWISGIGGIILGAFLLIFPEMIIPYVVYLFGLLLVAGGLTLICLMPFGGKGIEYPGFYYILPALVMIDGVLIISNDAISNNPGRLVLFTGIGFIIFAVSALLNLTTRKIKVRAMEKAARIAEDTPAEPVKTTEAEEPAPWEDKKL